MLSKSEWRIEAERSAARKWGEENSGAFFFWRFLAGPLGVVILAGLVGLGAYWLVRRAGEALSGGPALSAPVGFWVAFTALAVGTAVAFRPRKAFTTFSFAVVRAVIVALLWLGLLAFGIGML